MTAHDQEPTAQQVAEAWNLLSGNVLRGLNHGFSNRLSSLGAVAAGLGSEDTSQTMGDRVEAEMGRLEQLLRLYRLLPFVGEQGAEPSQVSDAVDDAVALFQNHFGLRDVPCQVDGDPSTPPVLFHSGAMVQSLVLMLSAAGRHLPEDGAGEGVVLRYSGDPDSVEIIAETVGAAPMMSDWPVELHAVRWLAREAAGEVSVQPSPRGGVRVRLRVGSLAFLRRRDRGG